MKKYSIVLGLLISVFACGQSQSNEPVLEFENYEVSFGKTITIGEFDIEFEDMSEDSRCPKAVMCVRAGEAIATLKIYKSGKLMKQKKIFFSPSANLANEFANIYNSESLKITAVDLLPYAMAEGQVSKSDYLLKVEVTKILN